MFFDKVLVENSELRRVWRAGFGRMEEPEENTSFPKISANLAECVGSEDPNPRSRLSLRTSSVLVEGAARIYRQELSRLLEDLSEVDRVMANRNERKLTDSDGDTSTESSNPSVPYDTPEHMRRQIPRQSDVSLQRPDNESMGILKSPDLSHSLSSISKSTNTQRSLLNDSQNDQSAKRRKMTDQTNLSTEYPSSLDLTTDRNSEDPISDEEPDLADENQNIVQIYEQPTKNPNAEFHSDDEAASKTDQNETEKSSKEENSGESLYSPTFTDRFDFVAALPNHPLTEIVEIDEERANMADKISEVLINEADTRNKSDEAVTIREKVTEEDTSAVRRPDDGVVKDSDDGRADVSPVLTSTARKVLKNSRRGTKSIRRLSGGGLRSAVDQYRLLRQGDHQ